MKNKKKIFMAVALGALFITSCGNNPSTPVSPSEPVSPSDPVSPLTPEEKFIEAINNTTSYCLMNNSLKSYYEIYQEDFYFYGPSRSGYVVLDDDPNFFHPFDIGQVVVDDNEYETMKVYGRMFRKSELTTYVDYTIHAIISYLKDGFQYLSGSEGTYYCDNKDIAEYFKNFFQSTIYGQSNYFEIDIKDGRLSALRICEKYEGHELIVNGNYRFTANNGKEAYFYTNWVELGKQHSLRVRDVKYFITNPSNPTSPISPYENQIVTLENCIVTGFGAAWFYIAQNDERSGPIGLRVDTVNPVTDLVVGEHINITGRVYTHTYNSIYVILKDVSYTKTGDVSGIPPAYDEDYMVDKFGGGTYAAMMFTHNLIYGGSLYSTYAYLFETPVFGGEDYDTVVTLICPNIVELGKQPFLIELVIPREINATLKQEMFDTLTAAGVYQETEISTAVELTFENFIVDYIFDKNMDYTQFRGTYHVSIVATENSIIYNKKTLQEKVETYFGLENFPVCKEDNMSYKFGGASGLFIEETYGDFVNKDKTGLFVGYENVTSMYFSSYMQTLVSYGFEKVDEVKDYSGSRHYLYTLGNVVIDLCLESNGMLLCWIYNSPVVRGKTIEEKLDEAIGSWFDVETEFKRISGTYDADYKVYSLTSYAGIEYSNPLTVVAIDLPTDRRSDVITEYVQDLGYGQYRKSEGGLPATYTIRGCTNNGLYSKTKDLFISVGSYPTTDYTYVNHEQDFTWRVEMVFTQSKTPIEIPTYNNLDLLLDCIEEEYAPGRFEVTLPSDAVVEYWFEDSSSLHERDVRYGYGGANQAYVYTSNSEELFNTLVEALTDAGYIKWGNTKNVYQIIEPSTTTDISHMICLIKRDNYVRVIQGSGGYDFWDFE